MARLLKNLWRDDCGSVGSAEIMLIMTLVCIGMIVGMKSLRDAAVTEMADMAQALANLNQSYSFSAGAVSTFDDTPDFCDGTTDVDVGTPGSKCVNVCVAASGEGP
jgi:Flp pilus assembly pilin Flp